MICVINCYSGPPPPSTLEWVREQFGDFGLMTKKEVPYIAGRNSMIRDVMLPELDKHPETKWCFFLDNDVTITYPGIERFMKIDADIVSCGCRMPVDGAWKDKNSFHSHFWKCRPEVLRKIQPPWFNMNFSEDGCDLLGCDCQTFRDKAVAAGFIIRHGGHCEHASAHTWR